ncbi:MAG: hypothetical protein KF794_15125 [Xanthobacteraceae bacterium]|nr:hypothetical protein [Xanthobacteraceae bacterium]QYK45053.1 MAG: hypothetical protein KF794_15125 [Xanthobacteraceae bacterium]
MNHSLPRNLLVLAVLSSLTAVLPFAGPSPSFAQTKKAEKEVVPNAFQGFSRNRKDPIKIEANSLEVKDKDKTAVFTGNVIVTQGDTTMRCRELTIFYDGNALSAVDGKDKKEQPAPQAKAPGAKQTASAQKIKRLIAVGGVIVTATNQKATGDHGLFEMATNTVTLTGNVVVTQGPNVMNGSKLVVDLNSGRSRLDGQQKGGSTRVHGLFVPNSVDEKNKDAKDGNKDGNKKKPARGKKTSPDSGQ